MTFTHNEKKILASKIENITNKKDFKDIFKIIYENNCNYIENDNGVYINLNVLNDVTLIKIKQFLEVIENNKNIIPTPKEYVPYCSDDNSSDIKLSIQEKNLLKKFKNNSKSEKQSSTNNDKVKSFNLFMSD
jgi:molybdenum cofactor biosynthesis enzyme MoaA